MIKYQKVRYKNILSAGNQFIEIDLLSNKTTLIVGSNGAGKTTLLDAICFGLFNKPFRKINKHQLVNSITKKNLVVEVEFQIGTNQYKVVRGIKPTIFEVYKDGVLLNQSADSDEYQRILEKQIIKKNHKTFCQVVVLGSATYSPFMTLTAAQRRAVIEDLLDLQIFTTMNSIMKDDIASNYEQIVSIQNEKKIIDEKIKLIKEHLSKQNINNQAIIDEKKALIEETETKLTDLEAEKKQLEGLIVNLSSQIINEQTYKSKINELSSLRHKIVANLNILKKDVAFFKKHDDCPTCKQPIDEKFKLTTIETKQEEIDEIDSALIKLADQYKSIENKINEIIQISSKIESARLEIHRIELKIKSLIDYSKSLQKDVDRINVSGDDDHGSIHQFENDIENNRKQNAILLESRQILGISAVMLKDGGIKAKIIKQYIPVINKLINKYLASLEFMCEFHLDEEFNETIKSRFRDEFTYHSFSEGEKQKINLAILFTWRAIAKLRNSINTNLLIMDETLDSSVDTNGVEYILKIIDEMEGANVFIISHREMWQEKFDTTLRFTKTRNFSTLQ